MLLLLLTMKTSMFGGHERTGRDDGEDVGKVMDTSESSNCPNQWKPSAAIVRAGQHQPPPRGATDVPSLSSLVLGTVGLMQLVIPFSD